MRFFLLLAASTGLFAQSLSPVLRLGVPATPLLTSDPSRQTFSLPFTFGPGLELHLWRGLAAGADFLLRSAEIGSVQIREWELPATFVYRFHAPGRPFLRAGVSVNRIFDIAGAAECGRGPFGEQFYCVDDSPVAELRHRGTAGFVLGGGFRRRVKRVWLEPEIRLTHGIDRNIGVRDSAVRSNLNQLELLIGVMF